MLIGLRESGTQNHTRLRILRKSFWGILRYDSAWSRQYFAQNSHACKHVCILLRHLSHRIILMVLLLGEFSSSPLQSFHATNNCVSWLGKKVIYYPSFAAMSIWTYRFRNCSYLNEMSWILIDTLMMLYLQSIDVSVHVTSDEKVCFIQWILTKIFTGGYVWVASANTPFYFLLLQQKEVQKWACLWNGVQRPCYLFARKFYPEALDNLLYIFSNYTAIWARYFWLSKFFGWSNCCFRPVRSIFGSHIAYEVVNCHIIRAEWSRSTILECKGNWHSN